MLEAMTKYLIEQYELDEDRKVVDFTEQTRSMGFCDTCYSEYVVLVFTLDNGETLTVSESMAELIRSITDYEKDS